MKDIYGFKCGHITIFSFTKSRIPSQKDILSAAVGKTMVTDFKMSENVLKSMMGICPFLRMIISLFYP